MAAAASASTASTSAPAPAPAAAGEGSAEPVVPPRAFTLGLCQFTVGAEKESNLAAARKAIAEAVSAGAELVVLPEIFNGPYDTKEFSKFAEPVPAVGEEFDAESAPSLAVLSAAAKEHGIFLVGGSISEVEEGKDGQKRYFNTCTVWNTEGELVAKHRKMHLFDIDVKGKLTFKESDILSPGGSLTTVDTPWARVGLGICYDLRFPQMANLLRYREGCDVLIYPGAFNTTTGPMHWELLLRSRAVDNQVFVAACSPARNPDATYQAWGHSTIVDPWGEVLGTCDHTPAVVTARVDLKRADEVRASIPVSGQRRTDLYKDVQWHAPDESVMGAARAACARVGFSIPFFS